ncbi:unnamed protein product [Clonostachys chloroleuca]|uniref:Uncharacterized protein n=1 Tax=Clonostachys chloroleuca TaxID=1926264 RepID=A0AA35M3M7_9HYPO|nr:unnamed protein product [Clonostachys chloroleuca]
MPWLSQTYISRSITNAVSSNWPLNSLPFTRTRPLTSSGNTILPFVPFGATTSTSTSPSSPTVTLPSNHPSPVSNPARTLLSSSPSCGLNDHLLPPISSRRSPNTPVTSAVVGPELHPCASDPLRERRPREESIAITIIEEIPPQPPQQPLRALSILRPVQARDERRDGVLELRRHRPDVVPVAFQACAHRAALSPVLCQPVQQGERVAVLSVEGARGVVAVQPRLPVPEQVVVPLFYIRRRLLPRLFLPL